MHSRTQSPYTLHTHTNTHITSYNVILSKSACSRHLAVPPALALPRRAACHWLRQVRVPLYAYGQHENPAYSFYSQPRLASGLIVSSSRSFFVHTQASVCEKFVFESLEVGF